ncbi:hypothetical protein DOY81_006661, partial [Sarcophaga bullata]
FSNGATRIPTSATFRSSNLYLELSVTLTTPGKVFIALNFLITNARSSKDVL